MSMLGILSSNLFSSRGGSGNTQNEGAKELGRMARSFSKSRREFQQLGQDLQSGNLTQAQPTTPRCRKFSGRKSNQRHNSNFRRHHYRSNRHASTSTTGSASVAQQFAQLGQDLQSGNLQAAQQDYTNIQQTAQQNIGQQNADKGTIATGIITTEARATRSSSSSSSQQSNPISRRSARWGRICRREIFRERSRRSPPCRTTFNKSADSFRPDRAARVGQPPQLHIGFNGAGSLNVTA